MKNRVRTTRTQNRSLVGGVQHYTCLGHYYSSNQVGVAVSRRRQPDDEESNPAAVKQDVLDLSQTSAQSVDVSLMRGRRARFARYSSKRLRNPRRINDVVILSSGVATKLSKWNYGGRLRSGDSA